MTEELIGASQARLEGSPFPVQEARTTFEAAVGLPLPSRLRRVFMDVGNGGCGPWAGRLEENFFLLRFCDGGCTVFGIGLADGDILWQTDSLHAWFGLLLADEQAMSFGDPV